MDFYEFHAFVAAGSHYSSLCPGNHGYPVPAFSYFQAGKRPSYVKYLGKALPSAVFALLVVYCLKDVSLFSGSHGIPEALSMTVTTVLHLWKRQMLLSMAGGTICYMMLVQYVF